MELYKETLTNVLMPEGCAASWHESEEFALYLEKLSSCGISKLSSECDHLREEQSLLLEQTKELAYNEYLTFIHAADCSQDLVTQLSGLETDLLRASGSVSSLHGTLQRFVSTSRRLLASRQLNTTTLAKHTQLLEVLELSQLLDTCVRSGYHDEALDIIAYARRLEKKHGHIPIVKSIVAEVQASSQQMLSQLLSQLRSDISLPHCLKVVGLVRTLDVFTECQLRIKFLHARDSWLTAALRAVPHHDPYQHLSKSVECARVHLFDIVTQYRAIFSDDETRFPALSQQDTGDLQAVLQSWILHKVSGILAMLRRDLAKGSICGSNLEALLAQCMFFGQSLSRIGADFRSLLPEIFQEAAGRQLERDVRAANHKFDESLSAFSLLDAFPSPLLQSSGGPGRPPISLLEFPPLGHYLNSLVTALNTLRLCCFTALLPQLLLLLTDSLSKVVRSLLDLHQVECAGFSAAETASFSRLCGVVSSVLVPHLNTACLRALYPIQGLAQLTGISAVQLSKTNFGQLDGKTICRPLEPFLPVTEAVADPDKGAAEVASPDEPVAGAGSHEVGEEESTVDTPSQSRAADEQATAAESEPAVTKGGHRPLAEDGEPAVTKGGHRPLAEDGALGARVVVPSQRVGDAGGCAQIQTGQLQTATQSQQKAETRSQRPEELGSENAILDSALTSIIPSTTSSISVVSPHSLPSAGVQVVERNIQESLTEIELHDSAERNIKENLTEIELHDDVERNTREDISRHQNLS